MYTIVMDKYKNLNTTVKATIYQQESMVDKIQFLVPPTYQDANMIEYIATLKYVDPYGNFHSETLTVDTELYKDYLRYLLPVTTKLTQVAGNISMRITFVKFTNGEDEMVIDKLETNSTTIRVDRPTGFVDNVNFEDIEAWKAQLNQMSRDVNSLQDDYPEDLIISEEDDKLHLSHEGSPIGEGVAVMIPSAPDEDGTKDGVIEVDKINEEEPEGENQDGESNLEEGTEPSVEGNEPGVEEGTENGETTFVEA